MEDTPTVIAKCFSGQCCRRGEWKTCGGREVPGFLQVAVLPPHSVLSLASCSRCVTSLGRCSVKSELSCHTLMAPVASPAARRWVCFTLNSKQYTGCSPAACFMDTAGFCELLSKSKRYTSPVKHSYCSLTAVVSVFNSRVVRLELRVVLFNPFPFPLDGVWAVTGTWHHCRTVWICSAVRDLKPGSQVLPHPCSLTQNLGNLLRKVSV